jgi:hypothetical protein
MLVEDLVARLPTTEVCDGLDNDCNGKVDELFDLKNDAWNCGGCGIVCGQGARCDLGRCAGGSTSDGGVLPPPPPGGVMVQVQIGVCPQASGAIVCVDLMSDPTSCGGCSKACAQGEFCGMGTCRLLSGLPAGTSPPPVIHPPCPAPPTTPGDGGAGSCPGETPDICKGPAGGAYCTNLRYDNASCGACGTACTAGTFCRDGRCAPADTGTADGGAPACMEPFKICSDPFGGQRCTDITRDRGNCGGCGVLCPQDTFCDQGKCSGTPPPPPDGGVQPPPPDGGTMQCPPGAGMCMFPAGGMYCADLVHDPANCGSCGTVCAPNQICLDGKCQLPPPGPDGGTPPPPPPDGAPPPSDGPPPPSDGPPPPCQAPMTSCQLPTGGMVCTDLNYDRANCGSCGNACAQGQVCQAAKCTTPPDGAPPPGCNPPMTSCTLVTGGMVCTDLNIDRANCGACNNPCPQDQVCQTGKCMLPPPPPTCQAPQTLCMPPTGGGYCADLAKDNLNCGRCGVMCMQPATCQSGTCK